MNRFHNSVTCRLLIAVWLISCGCGFVEAEDRVSYRPEGATSVFILVGEIVSSTGQELEIRPTGGVPVRIPITNVVEVQTHYDPDHLAGIELFRAGRIEEAIDALHAGLEREPRNWVDREILAWLVRCHLRQNDEIAALNDFRQIVLSDPYTRHWGLAPMEWLPRQVNHPLSQSAKSLLVDTRPGLRLLGASLLLFDPELSTTARREMDDLCKNLNSHIADLARAQMWRVALANREVTRDRLQRWHDQIDDLPAELRPGPQYLLAKGYQQLGFPRLAAAEYLKLTILYSDNEALTARATLEAADALQETGLTQGASVLYRELLTRFPESNAAKNAPASSTANQAAPSEATQ